MWCYRKRWYRGRDGDGGLLGVVMVMGDGSTAGGMVMEDSWGSDGADEGVLLQEVW